MIDKEMTIKMFGYDPDDLKSKSGLKVVVVCEGCRDVRILRMIDFSNLKHGGLCHSCSRRGILHSEETKELLRSIAKNRTPEEIKRRAESLRGFKHSQKTCDSLSFQRSGEKHWNFGRTTPDKTRKKIADHHIGTMLGADNPNWRGGITTENNRFYTSTEYNQWRQSIFERDNFTCLECGDRTSGNLNAHHILPYRDWREPIYSLNPSNGITLCKECHRITYGCEYDFFSKYFDLANGITRLQ